MNADDPERMHWRPLPHGLSELSYSSANTPSSKACCKVDSEELTLLVLFCMTGGDFVSHHTN